MSYRERLLNIERETICRVELRGSSARHKASVAIRVENLIVMFLEIGTFI